MDPNKCAFICKQYLEICLSKRMFNPIEVVLVSALLHQRPSSKSTIPLILGQSISNEKLCRILNIYQSLKDGNKFLIVGKVFPRKC